MMYQTDDQVIVREHPGSILQISLNRPVALNALNHSLLKTLASLFHEIKQDERVRAILLTGEGKGFCAGADIASLKSLDQESGERFALSGQAVFSALENLGKPSLAVIHGFAMGGGLELAMAATMRIAASNALFSQPEVKLGVIPGFGGTVRLRRLAGAARALHWCLTGQRFNAEDALQAGVVTSVVAPESLFLDALTMLQAITALPRVAIHEIIQTIQSNDGLSLPLALTQEAAAFGRCCASSDKEEGVNAFLEKRHAVFTGH